MRAGQVHNRNTRLRLRAVLVLCILALLLNVLAVVTGMFVTA